MGENQKLIASMVGYKATNKDMECRGHKFELGVWYEVQGELQSCEWAFHFCEQPSGPWAYYSDAGTRVFKVEAEGILEVPAEPGAVFKRVARRIRLVEEIIPAGNSNTGHSNTGHSNTGNRNTGHSNTGDHNTGFFCAKEPTVRCFDVDTKLTYDQFVSNFPEYQTLRILLQRDEPITFEEWSRLPGITAKKLKELHAQHLAAKAKAA